MLKGVSIPDDKIKYYSVEVQWKPPFTPNGKIGYYFSYWESSAGPSSAKTWTLPESVHSKLVPYLKPYTLYTFSVVPYNLRKNLAGPPFVKHVRTKPTGMNYPYPNSTFPRGDT